MNPAETRQITLAEFLLARIAEDEAIARRRHAALGSPGPETTWGKAAKRTLAECEAKRRIVNAWRSGFLEEDRYSTGWHDFHVHALCLYASVYTDHPDYREEWRA